MFWAILINLVRLAYKRLCFRLILARINGPNANHKKRNTVNILARWVKQFKLDTVRMLLVQLSNMKFSRNLALSDGISS